MNKNGDQISVKLNITHLDHFIIIKKLQVTLKTTVSKTLTQG